MRAVQRPISVHSMRGRFLKSRIKRELYRAAKGERTSVQNVKVRWFRQLAAVLAERNSTKTGHMHGSKWQSAI